MNNRERFVIYGVLALLLGLNMQALWGQGGRPAMADAGLQGESLGPAESLSLIGDEGTLVVRNRGGRLAWADGDHAQTFSTAFVHIGRAMGPLLESEHYVEEYADLEEEIRLRAEDLTAELRAFQEQHQDTKPDDPDAQQILATHQEMMRIRERWRVEGNRRLGKLAADQIVRAYRDFVAAVEVVAQRAGIDIVFRFIPTGNDLDVTTPPQAYTAIRARSAVTYPESLDLPAEVLEELAIELD